MAYTEDQLTTLQTAIASGQLTVSYRDRTVTYRSLDEMERVEAKLRAELSTSRSFENRGGYAKTSKGL